MPSRRTTVRVSALALVLALVLAACGPTSPPPYRDASNGTGSGGLPRGWFEGGKVWYGDFGDPHVMNVGGTYYAYGSPTGGRVLPMLTSTNTRRWEIHRRWSSSGPPGTPGYSVQTDSAIPEEIRHWWPSGNTTAQQREWLRYDNNDALVRGPSWGLDDPSNWLRRTIWAPGVAKIGGSWYAYYSVKTDASVAGFPYGRFCLSVAKASSPIGPFRDISGSQPLWCDSSATHPGGSIDPFPYVDPANGQAYLLWKASGKPGVRPSALMSMRLGTNGLPSAGQTPVTLLTTREGGWEGRTIENPSMIRYNGRDYLFYSGNNSDPRDSDGYSSYATGYAMCSQGPRAACSRKTVSAPLIGNTDNEWGPGGASAFVANSGPLSVMYSFFWPGERRGEYPRGEGRHPRRMNLAKMAVASNGTLTAIRRPWDSGGG